MLETADTIVWLDLPSSVEGAALWRRTADRIRDDVELWSGNKESWRGALWGRESLFLVDGPEHFRHRREWPERFAGDPRFVRLRSADEADAWLASHSS